MVQEVRKIMLSPDELVVAYDCYRRMTPGFLPEGKITACLPSNDGSVMVSIDVIHDGIVHEESYVLKGMEILKPMIRFCIENNVILPRDGRKSLSIADGSATLCIALNLHLDMSDSFTPMQTRHLAALTEVMPDPGIRETLAVVTA